jgi:hypothetical protein
MSRPSSFDVTEIIHRRPPLKMPVKLSISFLKLYAPLLTEIQNAKEARKREFNIYIYIYIHGHDVHIHSLTDSTCHSHCTENCPNIQNTFITMFFQINVIARSYGYSIYHVFH